MNLHFQIFPIIPPLRGYVEKIWLVQSPGKLPAEDLRLIVPNARPLFLISNKNALVADMAGRQHSTREHEISVVGICDAACIVDSKTDTLTSSIGLEFSPYGFYRFFDIPLQDIRNDLQQLSDISGSEVRNLERRLSDTMSPADKVGAIQSYLLYQLNKRSDDALFGYCVRQIEKTNGNLSIATLEKLTGYSSRWLNLKFKQNLGISPKNFSSIIRFQHYYHSLMFGNSRAEKRREYYDHFYDQSHFIKDFKRFTGMTPSKLLDIENKFGRLFY
jgi:AraC-like DNA-binding protein